MTRVLWLNSVGLLLIAVIAPLQLAFGMRIAIVDVALVIVIYAALAPHTAVLVRPTGMLRLPRPSLLDPSGVVTVLLLGYLDDVLGGGPKGVYGVALGVVYLLGRALARRVYVRGVVARLVITFFASLLASLVALALTRAAGQPASDGSIYRTIAVQAAVTALAAPPLMALLGSVDAKLCRGSFSRAALS